ncbi:ABC transporter ATP-binding protein [Oceanobacillus sp. FSL W8-0428]|uniref:Quaternary amine transport ATP-binding protein n=1 Tax=Oceanobacillus sojae TaxID=582851 RepID=A0A511ZJ43_9BACI|nr:ABC transporter ATP-binding protein [Oceanobacillus sojae]GEN87455.1 glycine/betaine ABC transporter ATP-binding protein [Oceanobacillus sojae]
MITFDDITKTYPDGTTAVDRFNLTVEKGEFMTLIGPSGCGKTTTMKMINRLIDPSAGTIYIDDKPVSEYSIHELRWNIGYVLQQIALFPHLTVQENIQVVPDLLKWKKGKMQKRTDELLDMVGLDPSIFKKRYPGELSGGQQQRIGVIRALAADPDIVLMDEPFSALDPISREQLQIDINKLQTEIKKTIVFVTHDMDEALKMSDRICLMKEGSVVQCGSPEELMRHPENEFVEEFIGNRQSPWLKPIKEVMKKDPAYFKEDNADDVMEYGSAFFMLVDKNQILKGIFENHKEQKEAVTIPVESTVEDAYAIIRSVNQTHFPVVENGQKAVGVITSNELLQYFYQQEKEGAGIL